jgi:hypothetical protein
MPTEPLRTYFKNSILWRYSITTLKEEEIEVDYQVALQQMMMMMKTNHICTKMGSDECYLIRPRIPVLIKIW